VRQNLREGNLTVGGLATSVLRTFDSDALRGLIPTRAEAVGTDWRVNWHKREYSFIGNLVVSEVGGDTAAIARLQRSSARYFQRPDRGDGSNGIFSDRFDPQATSLRGIGGYGRVAKDAGPWQFESAVDFRSPGFEVNDLGFMPTADYVWNMANLLRVWNKPTRRYRSMVAILGAQQQVNFDSDLTGRDVHGYLGGQLANYWNVSTFAIWSSAASDDRLTRGGPVVRTPASMLYVVNLSTDNRKRVVLSTGPSYSRNTEGGWSWSADLRVGLKPATNVKVSFSPAYSVSRDRTQFVARFADPSATAFYGQRVVFSDLEQHVASMNTRLNWTFSPTLTLELFAQPFIATGSFSGYKEFVRARSIEKHEFDAQQLTPVVDQGRVVGYELDPDRNAATANFQLPNPDFNFRSLRGNAVLRWEYRPGSTLFLVWQQQRSGVEPFGTFDLSRETHGVFDAPPDNVFVVKVSYWFGR